MKFAAIKANMGIWRYYVTTLTYGDIASCVSPITDEISNSESYANLLQRSITSNVDSVKEYILTQPERFFSSIVLAIYDGNPEWYELDVEVEEYSTYSVGVLEITPGEEIIFPVDGQHRVEGIKKAIIENPELENEKVPVIFIGHQNTKQGKQRTRRLFSTLNRRAKRVSDNEIVALDEDDVIAIATREVAEHHPLFQGFRMIDSKNKNIPSTNRIPFTSILALYEINKMIFDDYATGKGMKKVDQVKYLLYRPKDEEVMEFIETVAAFWNFMISEIDVLSDYMDKDEEEIIEAGYRSTDGGHLLFRPIALAQFVQAIIVLKKRKGTTLANALGELKNIPMSLNELPWRNLLWLEDRKTINGRPNKKELMNLMLAMADYEILTEKEQERLLSYLIGVRNLDDTHKEELIQELRSYRGQ